MVSLAYLYSEYLIICSDVINVKFFIYLFNYFLLQDVEEGNILLLVKALRSAIQLERFENIGTALRDNLVVVILKVSYLCWYL